MKDNSRKDHTAEKQLLDEPRKKLPPDKLDEFCTELHLALDIFFEGESEREGTSITLTLPHGLKFRIIAELLS